MTARPLLIGILVLVLVAACAPAGTGGADASPRPSTGASSSQPSPQASPSVPESATAAPTTETRAPLSDDVPSRIVLPDLAVDLPIVSGEATVPGNPRDYPLCDVAQYLTTYRYPGRLGTTTWIYAHAREGMFLELLEASERDDGAELIGQTAILYSTDARRYTYVIDEVLRHATDRSAAAGVPPDSGRLVLQTSEGPKGTVPKLQVTASLVESESASADEAMPSAAPRGCFEP